MSSILTFLFFFNDTPTTEIYTLSLHDALPIQTPSGLARRFAAPPPAGKRRPAPGSHPNRVFGFFLMSPPPLRGCGSNEPRCAHLFPPVSARCPGQCPWNSPCSRPSFLGKT